MRFFLAEADTEHLLISFTASDPRIAASGVTSIINAYIECDGTDNRDRPASSLADREEGEADFQKQMDLLQGMERDIARQFDPNAATRAHVATTRRSSLGAASVSSSREFPVFTQPAGETATAGEWMWTGMRFNVKMTGPPTRAAKPRPAVVGPCRLTS